MASVTPIDSIRLSHRAARFEGRDQIAGSIFVMEYARGEGPDLHTHPYPEAFVIQSGTAVFTVGEEELRVAGGNIVVVPAETVHGFKNRDDVPLRAVSFHPSPTVKQTDL